MSVVLGKLKEWMETWAPEELVEGLPGQGSRTIHEDLFADIEAALEAGEQQVGANLDVKKCFDTINPRKSIRVADILGLPRGVTNVLLDFHKDQERLAECEGCVADRPPKPTMSVLQGCPASMVLLAMLMAVWTKLVGNEPWTFEASLSDPT